MTKISQLSSIGDSLAIGDQFLIRDIDDTGSPNKSVTISGMTRALDTGTALAPALAFASDKNTGIYSPGADQVAISTNGTERLFIDSAGKIGIGTASPTGKLDVTGSNVPLIVQSTVAASNYIAHRHVTSGDIAYIGNGGGGALTAGTASDYAIRANLGSLIFGCNGDNERARIDSSGRLLVGTSSDSGGALLQVNGDRVRIATAKTPASAGATGTTGEICWDANYIYVCTATNTWKRTAISTW